MSLNYIEKYTQNERHRYSERILEKISELKNEEDSINNRYQTQLMSIQENGDDEDVSLRKLTLETAKKINYSLEEFFEITNISPNTNAYRILNYLNIKKIGLNNYMKINVNTEIEDLSGCWAFFNKYESGKDRVSKEYYDYKNIEYKDEFDYEGEKKEAYKKISEDNEFKLLSGSKILTDLKEASNFIFDNVLNILTSLKKLSDNDYVIKGLDLDIKKYFNRNCSFENGNIATYVISDDEEIEQISNKFAKFGDMYICSDDEVFFISSIKNKYDLFKFNKISLEDYAPVSGVSYKKIKFEYKSCEAYNKPIDNCSAYNKKNEVFNKYKNKIKNTLIKCKKIIDDASKNEIFLDYNKEYGNPIDMYELYYKEINKYDYLDKSFINKLFNFLSNRINILNKIFIEEEIDGEIIQSGIIEEFNTYLCRRMDKNDGTLINWFNSCCSLDSSEISLNKNLKESKMIFKKLLVWPITIDEYGNNYFYLTNKINDKKYGLSDFYKKSNEDIKKEEELKTGDTIFLADSYKEHGEIKATILSITNETLEIDEGPEVSINTNETDINNIRIKDNPSLNVIKVTVNTTISDIFYSTDGFRLIKER